MKISEEVRELCPDLRLLILTAEVEVKPSSEALKTKMAAVASELKDRLEVADIAQLPTIQATRKGYKALGKDPARYRPSAEALLRRVVKGKGLYYVSNVVDIINLVSIQTGFSIGGYDAEKIDGSVTLTRGKAEPYEAIGRGELNIEFLPVFRDETGPFGSPTSDSLRTSITPQTKNILLVVLDFSGAGEIVTAADLFREMLIKFAETGTFAQEII